MPAPLQHLSSRVSHSLPGTCIFDKHRHEGVIKPSWRKGCLTWFWNVQEAVGEKRILSRGDSGSRGVAPGSAPWEQTPESMSVRPQVQGEVAGLAMSWNWWKQLRMPASVTSLLQPYPDVLAAPVVLLSCCLSVFMSPVSPRHPRRQ